MSALRTFSPETAHSRVPWLVLYALSGCVGLSYEVLWARLLALQFGVSVLGVVVTVAAFMAGLGGGALLGGWGAPRLRRPLLALGLLEGLVAGFAAALPALSRGFQPWLDLAAARLDPLAWQGLNLFVALVLLTIPALGLGALFPLLLQARANPALTLGWLYGINTLGAVVGALLPLFTLPQWGWAGSSQAAAALGLVTALGWLALAHTLGNGSAGAVPGQSPGEASTEDETASPGAQSAVLLEGAASQHGGARPLPSCSGEGCHRWQGSDAPDRLVPRSGMGLYLVYALTGAAGLMLEVGWARLYGLLLLRTEYVLGLVLAVYLIGLAIGSLGAERCRAPHIWLRRLPWLAGGGVLFSLEGIALVAGWLERAHWDGLGSALALQGLLLLLLTLPVTLSLGAWLPLLAAADGRRGVALYASNALGAAGGALVAGWVLLPWLGTAALVVVGGALLLVTGLWWARPRRNWCTGAGLLVWGALASQVWALPAPARLLPQALGRSHSLYRYEDAVALTEVVEQEDGQRLLLTDLQRRDAATDPTAVLIQANQARLPLLLHAHPRTVLFEGLGTGISVAGSAAFPGLQREAVELSLGAIVGARTWFAPFNQAALPQTMVWRDDARHFLSANRRHYDVIIGDLFHPDLAGVSSLLSVQQFARARAHLNPGGLFAQWIALNQFDPATLGWVVRSFRTVFPAGQMFLDGMHLALIGPRDQWNGGPDLLAHWSELTPVQRNQASAFEGPWTWLGRYWGPIPASAGPVQDEWAPQIEFSLPRLHYSGSAPLQALLSQLLAQRPTPTQARALLQLNPQQTASFDRAYDATEALVHGWLAALQGQDELAQRWAAAAVAANPADHWAMYALADRTLGQLPRLAPAQRQTVLRKLLQLHPDQPELLRALWKEQRAVGDPAAARTLQELLLYDPLDRTAASAKN